VSNFVVVSECGGGRPPDSSGRGVQHRSRTADPGMPLFKKKNFERWSMEATVPQDVLLIHDLIGPLNPPTQSLILPRADADDSVDSSGESTDSAEEVEANLLYVGRKSTRSVLYYMHLTLQLNL
jgi:hypothetical protein